MMLKKLCLYVYLAIVIALSGSVCMAQKDEAIPGAAIKLLAEPKTDSADFQHFAALCLHEKQYAQFISVYNQLIDSGKRAPVINDMPVLKEVFNSIDSGSASEANFYTCYYIGKILIKYHLDSIAPIYYYQRCVRIGKAMNDACLAVKGNFGIESYYMNIRHDLLKASEAQQETHRILEESGKNGILDCGTDDNKGPVVLYYYFEDYNRSIEYLNKSISAFKKINRPLSLFDLYCRKSYLELLLSEYRQSLLTLDSARMEIANSNNYAHLINYLQADSVNVYVTMGDDARALQLSNKVSVSELDGDNDEYYDYVYNLVKLYIRCHKYKEAAVYVNDYTKLLKPWNIQRWKNAYEMKYMLSKAEHNIQDALKYYELYASYNDSVHHQRQNFAVIAQNVKYQTQQKEKELELQIAANHAQKQRTRFIAAAFVALCLLLLLMLVYRINRELREKNRMNKLFSKRLIQNTEKEQQRLAHELHDGLGQELLLLKTSLQQSEQPSYAVQVGEIIDSVRNMARELHPPLLEILGIDAAIQQQLQRIDERERIFVSADITYSGQLDAHTKLQVYRIFQEAMTNVLKYADATSVYVSLKQEAGMVVLIIKDNGKGFDLLQQPSGYSGFGMQSMRQRADSISGILKVTSVKNKGTEINLIFPEK